MNDIDVWKTMYLSLAVSIFSFFSYVWFIFKKRLVEDIPTSKIVSAAQGYVELTGYARGINNQPVKAPLTGAECVWYSYEISQKTGDGYKIIEKKRSNNLFLLVDNTGEVVIDSEGAEVISSTKDIWYGRTRWPEIQPGEKQGWWPIGRSKYHYIEHRIHPGSVLYAIGLFSTVRGENVKYNLGKDLDELLTEWKKDSDTLLERFDTNKDGEIDVEEWKQIRKNALDIIVQRHKNRKVSTFHTMGKTCDKRRPYILSGTLQSSVLSKHNEYSKLAIKTGIATLVITIILAVSLYIVTGSVMYPVKGW